MKRNKFLIFIYFILFGSINFNSIKAEIIILSSCDNNKDGFLKNEYILDLEKSLLTRNYVYNSKTFKKYRITDLSVKKENSEITIYSDSKYVIDSVEKKWVFGWEKKNFNRKKNPDLWIRFLKIYRVQKVSFIWVKGHANNKENERCDFLAVEAADSQNLLTDLWYENNVVNKGGSLF